jgi:hypothetical protein
MRAAVGELGAVLGGMPVTAADEVGGPRVEFDDNFVFLVAFHDGEAAGKVLVGIEIFRAEEVFGGEGRIGQAGEGEGADGVAGGVVGEEVPVVVDAGEVVRVDMAGQGLASAEVAVIEFDGATFTDGAVEEAEGGVVGVFGAEGAEGSVVNGVGLARLRGADSIPLVFRGLSESTPG